MIIDHINNDRDLPLMTLLDELLEFLRCPVLRLHREELDRIVAPIVVGGGVVGELGILRDGQHFCPFTHKMAQLPRYASNATLSFYASNRVTFSIGCKVCNSFPSMGVVGAN